MAAQGVHLGIKKGRQSGVASATRRSPTQSISPAKESSPGRALRLMSRNIAANLLHLPHPEPYIDRFGRASGISRRSAIC